jgi:ABC-type branched-subunit amino acid transport system ATPase component
MARPEGAADRRDVARPRAGAGRSTARDHQDDHATGVAIVMVEQDVQTALEFATRAYVIETGRFTLAGTIDDLLDDPKVQKAYLGI